MRTLLLLTVLLLSAEVHRQSVEVAARQALANDDLQVDADTEIFLDGKRVSAEVFNAEEREIIEVEIRAGRIIKIVALTKRK